MDKLEFVQDSVIAYEAIASIHSGGNVHQFQVEIAETDSERMKGLMFRENLEESAGMLFIFQKIGPKSFWMKNTFISLDILFFDEEGVLLEICEQTKPLSTNSYVCKENVSTVLEVKAGTCRRLGIQKGDSIFINRF